MCCIKTKIWLGLVNNEILNIFVHSIKVICQDNPQQTLKSMFPLLNAKLFIHYLNGELQLKLFPNLT